MHVSWKDQRPRDSGKTVWISGGNSDGIDLEFSGHGKQRERIEGLMWKQHLMVSGRSHDAFFYMQFKLKPKVKETERTQLLIRHTQIRLFSECWIILLWG